MFSGVDTARDATPAMKPRSSSSITPGLCAGIEVFFFGLFNEMSRLVDKERRKE